MEFYINLTYINKDTISKQLIWSKLVIAGLTRDSNLKIFVTDTAFTQTLTSVFVSFMVQISR